MASPVRVASLRRYPVKSLHGEQVDAVEVDARGVVGDRQWAVRTERGKLGSGKNSRRFEAVVGLLEVRATTRDGSVVITFPDGAEQAIDDAAAAARLSDLLGQPLEFAKEAEVSHFDDGPVSLMGLGSVGALSDFRGEDVAAARFRPNIVLDAAPFTEESWIGRRVQLGAAVLEIELASPRCVMVDMKTADLPAQHGNLLATGALHATCLGVIAGVVQPGRIEVGDEASLVD